MLRICLALLCFQLSCNKIPEVAEAPTYPQKPIIKQKPSEEASPQNETPLAAPVLERVDEDTVKVVKSDAALTQDGQLLESSVVSVDNGAIVSYEKQSFVIKNSEPIKLPSLDLSLSDKDIDITLEVDDEIEFALVATDDEIPDMQEDLCLAMQKSSPAFVGLASKDADNCWVTKADLPTSIKAQIYEKGVHFKVSAATFAKLKQSFMQVLLRQKTSEQVEDEAAPVEQIPAVADSQTGIEVITVEQEQVLPLPSLIPDISDVLVPHEKSPEVDSPSPAEEIPSHQEQVASNVEDETEGADIETPAEIAVENEINALADDIHQAEIEKEQEQVPSHTDDKVETPRVKELKETINIRSARYNELKNRFKELHQERNEQREKRKAYRAKELKVQARKAKTCKVKGGQCEAEKALLAKFQSLDDSMTESIASLKAEIISVKQEADEALQLLRESKLDLKEAQGIKVDREALRAKREAKTLKKEAEKAEKDQKKSDKKDEKDQGKPDKDKKKS